MNRGSRDRDQGPLYTPFFFWVLKGDVTKPAIRTDDCDVSLLACDSTVFPIPTKKWHRVYSLWAAFLLLLMYYKRIKICPAIYLPKCINIFKETLLPCTTKCPQCCLCVFFICQNIIRHQEPPHIRNNWQVGYFTTLSTLKVEAEQFLHIKTLFSYLLFNNIPGHLLYKCFKFYLAKTW